MWAELPMLDELVYVSPGGVWTISEVRNVYQLRSSALLMTQCVVLMARFWWFSSLRRVSSCRLRHRRSRHPRHHSFNVFTDRPRRTGFTFVAALLGFRATVRRNVHCARHLRYFRQLLPRSVTTNGNNAGIKWHPSGGARRSRCGHEYLLPRKCLLTRGHSGRTGAADSCLRDVSRVDSMSFCVQSHAIIFMIPKSVLVFRSQPCSHPT